MSYNNCFQSGFLIVFLLIGRVVVSQEKNYNFSGNLESNGYWYTNDPKTDSLKIKERFRSNNYLTSHYRYKDISTGIQIESYAPMALLNYNPDFDKKIGISTYHFTYARKMISLTAGYFYEQFGSGLTLRSWEDRELGINNAIRGGRIVYTPTNDITIKAVYGNSKKGFEVSKGTVLGVDTTIRITDFLNYYKFNTTIGFSYVNRFQKLNKDIVPVTLNSEATAVYSSRLNFYKNNFNAEAEYVIKTQDMVINHRYNAPTVSDGDALLINLGYANHGLGINTTFRRIENIEFYSDRTVYGNLYNAELINFTPSLAKQHDYSLANIYVYQAQSKISSFPRLKIGEIGYSIDAFYRIKKGTAIGGKYGTKLAFNYSKWHGLSTYPEIDNRFDSKEYLGFGIKYYEDINLEIRKKWSKKISSLFMYINTYYNKKYIEDSSGEVNSNILVAESTVKLTPKKAIRLELQHLWTKEDTKNWYAGTVEFNVSHNLAFYVTDMYNYGNFNTQKKVHYYNVGASYSKKQHRLSVNYGRQRGGISCVGGVCRIVPGSTGLSFLLNSSF
jgi:hypothetical protein